MILIKIIDELKSKFKYSNIKWTINDKNDQIIALKIKNFNYLVLKSLNGFYS